MGDTGSLLAVGVGIRIPGEMGRIQGWCDVGASAVVGVLLSASPRKVVFLIIGFVLPVFDATSPFAFD